MVLQITLIVPFELVTFLHSEIFSTLPFSSVETTSPSFVSHTTFNSPISLVYFSQLSISLICVCSLVCTSSPFLVLQIVFTEPSLRSIFSHSVIVFISTSSFVIISSCSLSQITSVVPSEFVTFLHRVTSIASELSIGLVSTTPSIIFITLSIVVLSEVLVVLSDEVLVESVVEVFSSSVVVSSVVRDVESLKSTLLPSLFLQIFNSLPESRVILSQLYAASILLTISISRVIRSAEQYIHVSPDDDTLSLQV